MAIRLTRRGLVTALLVLGIAGAVGGSVAMRAAKKGDAAGPPGTAPAVTLEFTNADVAHVQSMPLARWLPVSGTLQPLNQATIKAKVSGDVRLITVREGETVQAGQVLARIDTADLEAKLAASIGAMESAKAQLALAEKTRATNQALLKQNFISQNAFDNSESSYSVSQGTVKSAEAQVQLARNALRDAVATSPLTGIVAKRHVQPGEKVAFDSPLVTVVDLNSLELQAMVPAVDVPELVKGMKVELSIDGFGDQRFTGKIERINPSTEPGNARVPRLCGHTERAGRAARRHVRDRSRRDRGAGADADAADVGDPHGRRSGVRVGDRRRQARPAQRDAGTPRRGRGSRRGQDGAARGSPDPCQQVRQPERGRAGAREGGVGHSGEAGLTRQSGKLRLRSS